MRLEDAVLERVQFDNFVVYEIELFLKLTKGANLSLHRDDTIRVDFESFNDGLELVSRLLRDLLFHGVHSKYLLLQDMRYLVNHVPQVFYLFVQLCLGHFRKSLKVLTILLLHRFDEIRCLRQAFIRVLEHGNLAKEVLVNLLTLLSLHVRLVLPVGECLAYLRQFDLLLFLHSQERTLTVVYAFQVANLLLLCL